MAILVMGIIRFVLTLAGFSDDVVKFFSMSVIIAVGTIYYAIATETHTERLKAAYLLILPYMIVEVAALGYTWASGRQTIFHSEKYSLGFPIGLHTLGHLLGGFTWEPLFVFLIMEVLWAMRRGFARLLFSH